MRLSVQEMADQPLPQRWHVRCYTQGSVSHREECHRVTLIHPRNHRFCRIGPCLLPCHGRRAAGRVFHHHDREGPESRRPPAHRTRRGRLSTRDRWRGAPYLRSSADETLRSHALDVALPPANSAFQGGASLQRPQPSSPTRTSFATKRSTRRCPRSIPPSWVAVACREGWASRPPVRQSPAPGGDRRRALCVSPAFLASSHWPPWCRIRRHLPLRPLTGADSSPTTPPRNR